MGLARPGCNASSTLSRTRRIQALHRSPPGLRLVGDVEQKPSEQVESATESGNEQIFNLCYLPLLSHIGHNTLHTSEGFQNQQLLLIRPDQLGLFNEYRIAFLNAGFEQGRADATGFQHTLDTHERLGLGKIRH